MRFLVLIAALALTACDSDEPADADTRFFAQTAVSGIVLTNDRGDVLGTTSGGAADDWQLRAGSPAGVFVSPVRPNPVVGPAFFTFDVPTAQRVRGVLVDREYREVAVVFDETVEAEGSTRVFELPAGLSPGIYRLVVEGDGWGTYGDVDFRTRGS